MTQSTVTIFSKPNCQYCARAKAVLKRAKVEYQEYDVTTSQRNADASVYFSGVVTVPQIFIGNYHINGAEDLEKLATAASKNTVDKALLDRLQNSNADKQSIEGTKMITSAFGFLNVFNDLTGLEIEGDWARQAQEKVGIEAGRHGSEDTNPANLDYEIPKGNLSIEDMLAKYDREIGDLETYTQGEFGLLPAWIQNWPEPLQKRHAYLYGELMGDREDRLISAELKHLMTRVSAISKGHDYLAAVEGYMAYHTATDKERASDRIRKCFIAATNRGDTSSIFSKKEQAALQLAWLSAQVPLTTPYRFIESAIALYPPEELVHLIVVCSVASMVQRFVAIAQPEIETEVNQFCTQHSIETNALKLRYPLSLKLEAVD